jgi:hypothetical protein
LAHPYADYEGEETWTAVDKAISDLVANGDLEEKTARSHIVGYICKLLDDMKRTGS